jgi:type IV pilus assembly protein PilB
MSTPRLRLGQLLVDAKLITADALAEALAAQRSDGRRLGTLLVERGLINETQLTQILSHQLSVPWVSLLHIEFSRQLLNLVPHDVADRYCLVPIYVRHVRNQGDTLYVAMDDPSNEEGLRACREHSGLPVRAMIAPPVDIRNAIRVYYGIEPSQPAVVARAAEPTRQAITEPAPPPTPADPVIPAPSVPPPAPPPAIGPVAAEAVAEPAVEPALAAPAEPVAEGIAEPAAEPVAEAIAEPATEPAFDVAAYSEAGPEIEAVEIAVLDAPSAPPPSEPPVENIPRPRGRAPRMVALTLLDGTTINLPAKRRPRPRPVEEAAEPPASPPSSPPPSSTPAGASEPPGPEAVQGLTARDLVLALRVVAHGADASEVLGSNVRWESLFASLLSLMLKKHLIADWEFVDELKKNL